MDLTLDEHKWAHCKQTLEMCIVQKNVQRNTEKGDGKKDIESEREWVRAIEIEFLHRMKHL